MNRSKKIVGSVFIALLIACLLLSVVGIGYYTDGFTNFVKDSAAPVDVVPAAAEANNLNVVIDEDHNRDVIQSGEGVVIQSANLASAPQNAEGDNYIRKTLVATVYPEDAADKTVLWSISWGANPKEEAVADFVFIEETSSNNMINVVCKQGFGDSTVIITCTTVVGSFKATCVCIFDGAPTRLNILYNGEETDANLIDLPHGTYYFDLALYNELGSIGSDYQNPNYIVKSVTLNGAWYLHTKWIYYSMINDYYVESLPKVFFDNSNVSYPIPDLHYDVDEYWEYKCSDERGTFTLSASEFIEASIVDNRLLVNVISDPLSWTKECSGRYSDRFNGSVVSSFDSWATIGHDSVAKEYLSCTIGVEDTVTGFVRFLYLKLLPGVNSVQLSNSEIVF